MAAGLVAAVALDFVSHAPNRIVGGAGIGLGDAPQLWLILLAALAGLAALAALMPAFLPAFLPARAGALISGLAAAGLVLALLGVAGSMAGGLAAISSPSSRTSLGAGFWATQAAAALLLVDALQRMTPRWPARLTVLALLALGLAALLASGMLAPLSLAREYAVRREAFTGEVLRHLAIVAGAVAITAFVGLPLGLAAARNAGLRRRAMPVLNVLQTIPSIALFGLLIGPLSALAQAVPGLRAIGISGIGIAPALTALVLYGLLPLVRTVIAGIQGVPPDAVDAARGAGMTSGQLLRYVEWPIALPVVVTGLRVVAVQTVGLTTVAALIGAGGLGTFVFQGLGQNAMDLVLLGALPIVILAILVDAAFAGLAAALRGPR